MPTYLVRYVRRNDLALWHEFWDGPEPSHRSIQANKDGRLQQSTVVDAPNAKEAADKVERDHLGCVAIRDATLRLDNFDQRIQPRKLRNRGIFAREQNLIGRDSKSWPT